MKYHRSRLTASVLTFAGACVCLLALGVPRAYAINGKVCAALMEEYSIEPYHSWGSTPDDVKVMWDYSDCNHKICQYMKDTYGVVPFHSWGSLPLNLQKVWDTPQVACNKQVQ